MLKKREPKMRPCEICSSLTRSHILKDLTYYCHKCWTGMSEEQRNNLIEKAKGNVSLQEELIKALEGGTVKKRDGKGKPIIVPIPIKPESKAESSEKTK